MVRKQVIFCSSCGSHLESTYLFGRLRPQCPRCGHIHFQDPKVAAAALIEDGGNVLLVRRSNSPEQGKWTLPGGFVDADEDPAEAAVREVGEETGLRVEITGLVDVIHGQEHTLGADIVIVYRGVIVGGTLSAADDADAARLFARGSLPDLAFQATKRVLETCGYLR